MNGAKGRIEHWRGKLFTRGWVLGCLYRPRRCGVIEAYVAKGASTIRRIDICKAVASGCAIFSEDEGLRAKGLGLIQIEAVSHVWITKEV